MFSRGPFVCNASATVRKPRLYTNDERRGNRSLTTVCTTLREPFNLHRSHRSRRCHGYRHGRASGILIYEEFVCCSLLFLFSIQNISFRRGEPDTYHGGNTIVSNRYGQRSVVVVFTCERTEFFLYYCCTWYVVLLPTVSTLSQLLLEIQ